MKSPILLLFLLLTANLHAQFPYSRIFDAKDALPGNDFYHCLQDNKGYLWIANDQGIIRYDGYQFSNFSTAEGLAEEKTLRLSNDRNGCIWACSFNGRLSKICSGEVQQVPVSERLSRYLGTKGKITSFSIDRNDTIWVGLSNQPFYLKLAPVGNSYAIKKIYFQEKGLIRFLNNGKTLSSFNPQSSINKVRLENQQGKVSYLKFDGYQAASLASYKNKFLVGYGNRIYVGTGESWEQIIPLEDQINDIGHDSSGVLLVATLNTGLLRIKNWISPHPESEIILPNTDVTYVLTDREGGLWSTTLGKGLIYIPSVEIKYFGESSGIPEVKFHCITVLRDGSMLAGSQNGQLVLFKNGKSRILDLNINPVTLNEVECIFQDGKGNIWVACLHSTYLFSEDLNKKITVIHNSKPLQGIRSFGETSDGIIWAGGYKVFCRFILENGHLQIEDLDARLKINNLTVDRKDQIWLACNSGLWKYNMRYFRFQGFNNPLLKKKINDVKVGEDDAIWVATQNDGVLEIFRDQVSHVSTFGGLSDNECHRIFLGQDQTVWAATKGGVSKISCKKNLICRIDNFNSRKGLPADDCFDLFEENGKTWVAHASGISLISRNATEAPLGPILPSFLSGAKAGEKELNNPESLKEIAYRQNTLDISFISISFKNQSKTRFRYKLLGLEENWNTTTSLNAHYPDLSPGEYQFIVQAENSEGVWGTDSPQWSFSILTPFWMKWWFILLSLGLLTGGIYLTVSYRLRLKHRKELEMANMNKKLVDMELQALRAQMNPHFIFNCINSIQHYIIKNNAEEASKYLSKFAKLMRNVLDNSKVQQISLEKELQTLELYMQLESLRFEEKFEFFIDCDPGIDLGYIEIPSMLIQPYIENAIWHGLMHKEEKGKIWIKIKEEKDHLVCTVEDNGIGREKSKRFKSKNKVTHKSVGMMITKERLEILNNIHQSDLSVKITDLENDAGEACGTRVEIFIPF